MAVDSHRTDIEEEAPAEPLDLRRLKAKNHLRLVKHRHSWNSQIILMTFGPHTWVSKEQHCSIRLLAKQESKSLD